MHCPVESRLYIKANGEIPCWCAYGENKILFHAKEETDFINSVLFGESYDHIRASLKRSVLPWPKFCKSCFFIDSKQPFYSQLVDDRRIDIFQVEPSFLCQLDCVACFPPKQKRTQVKSPPYNMPTDLFVKAADDLHRAGIGVTLFDFQGRGEPLMNRDVWKMVSYARELFPESEIALTTNGNFEYKTESVHSGLSRLYISVDGCFQDSYETYRKNGNIDKALRFMEQFAGDNKKYGRNIEIVWKYILFGHNDSDKELMEAQKKAMEFGIDVLYFEITAFVHSCKPTRFLENNALADFPLADTSDSSLNVILPDENYVKNMTSRVDHGKLVSILEWFNKWRLKVSGY